jgi:putative peptide zinc metalloprotease protein
MEPDINSIIPTLRPDLHFTLLEKEDEGYVLEDTLRQKFYRIGRAEYVLFTEIDGKTTLEEVITRANSFLGEELFNQENVKITLQWLMQNQLLSDSSDETVKGRLQLEERFRKQKLLGKFNLITIKIPLFNPDPIFEKISPWLRWFTGPGFAVIWGLTVLYGCMVLYQKSDQFFTVATAALSPENVFFLWLAWFLLKILHETSHALTTYRYHGRVFEAGILFIVFFPLTYVNGSSTWNFPNRWQRIHAAFAGIYAELFVAAVSVVIWADNPSSVAGNIAHNMVIVAGFSSLIFNINPLMRFDGYFILSDLVAIPNLYSRGKSFVSSVWTRIFFGEWRYLPRYSRKQEIFIAIYGVAAWIWRLLIMTFLLLLVASTVHGFGIFIAIVSCLMIVGMPVWRLKGTLLGLYRENQPAFKRFCAVTGLFISMTILLLNLLHWERELRAPAVVQYENESLVRVKVAGFVEEIFVKSGEQVTQGQILLELSSPDLVAELSQQKIRLDQVLLQKRNAIIREDVTSYQVLEEQSLVIRKNIKALEEDLADLKVTAETDGTVLAYRLEEILGVYLTRGREILSIVTENDKKLLASVDQKEIESFRGMEGKPLEVIKRSMDRSFFMGIVTQVSPKADTSVPDKAFNAAYGGPLAVKRAQQSSVSSKEAVGDGYAFFYPRFGVEIEVPASEADQLLVGQLTTIRMQGQSVSLWRLIKNKLIEYFSKKLSRGNTG